VSAPPAYTLSRPRLARTGGPGVTATYALVGDAPLGPFEALGDVPLVDTVDTLYSGKIIAGPLGAPVFLAFRGADADGMFAGEIIDPLPVTVGGDRRLRVG
jgi:hypothetical protein